MKILHIRMLAFVLVIGLITFRYQIPLKQFSADMSYPCAIWVFPFLLTRDAYLILFYFGVIYVNSDIPFLQYSNMYQLNRLGRKKWVIAQIGAVFFRSLTMVLLTVFCSIISLLPHIEFTFDWGKLIRTIASTDYAVDYNLNYNFYYEVLVKFTPLQLMALAIVITTMISTMLGLLMYMLVLYTTRILAVSAATALSVMIFFVVNMHVALQINLSRFVPMLWAQVARVYSLKSGFRWLPSVSYMFFFLIGSIVILSGMIIYKTGHTELAWEKEDV